jgi:8-amino-7-oxononanoate synthase
MAQTGYLLGESHHSIQPLILGSSEKAVSMSSFLKSRGIFAGAIRPPTVPKNTARIRFTITSAHTGDDIAFLVESLKEAEKLL